MSTTPNITKDNSLCESSLATYGTFPTSKECPIGMLGSVLVVGVKDDLPFGVRPVLYNWAPNPVDFGYAWVKSYRGEDIAVRAGSLLPESVAFVYSTYTIIAP